MRRVVFTLSILIGFVFSLYSQPWLKYLPPHKSKSELTLYDYQRAFELYKKDYLSSHRVGEYKGNLEDEGLIPGYYQFKRWEWYWEPRVDKETGKFPEISLIDIFEKYVKNRKSVGGTWVSLGPSNVNVDYSGTGRINCAAFDPKDDNHFWVGAASGGVWETTDGGQTWRNITDGLPTLGVSDIAIPPDYDAVNNPTIYIATGDRDALDDPGVGVLVTYDGGQTWQKTGLEFQLNEQVYVSRLIIDPNDPNVMWAATSVGIFKSIDKGATWSLKLGGEFIDMELFPGSTATGPGRLLASTNGFEPKIYLSTDGGETWTVTYDAANYTGTQYRADLAVTPADPNVAYFIMSDYDNSFAFEALFRSNDGGVTWTEVYNQSDNNLFGWYETNRAIDGGQGFYDIALAVSNLDPNVVYVGGVNGYISTDGGQTFTLCNQWYPSISTADVVHADHHNAYFRPSDNRLFDCNDGGFNYTDNVVDGKSSVWTNLTAGIVAGQIYGIGVGDLRPDVVIAGFQDNGTKLLDVPTTGNYNWADVKGGDGMNCDIDPTDDDVQWGTYVYLQIDMTTDRWVNATEIRASGGAAWAGPLVADPISPQTIYIGTDAVEKYSSGTWVNLSGTLDNVNYIRALDVYHDSNGNLVIWAASPNGVWRSDVTGQNFVEVSANGLPNEFVTDIAIDPNDYNHVYVCFGGYTDNVVYETYDGGQTWQNISEGLPPVPAGAIAVNKQNTSVKEVYVGTDAGIYVKYGDGPWQLFNDGMPYTSITDLDFYYDPTNPANTKIYASTYGRGVWVSDCYTPPNLDLMIYSVVEPADEYCDIASITPTFKVANTGSSDITSFTISYQLDNNTVVSQNWTGTLSATQSVTISFPAITVGYGPHKITAWISNVNGLTTSDDNPANDTITKNFDVWNNSLPYTQTFDNFTVNIGYIGTSVPLEQCWQNDPNESDLDWSVNIGATPSNGTGPTDDFTGGGKYLYIEVSGISAATSANLLSPTFDLSQWQNCFIEFYYYMYGANVGTLGPVSISTDGGATWTDLTVLWESTGTSSTTISGDQGQQWYRAYADISAYDGSPNVIIRIQATSGTSYDGDIAIDQFTISGDPVCTPPSVQASNLTTVPDYNFITLSWTRGDGDSVIVLAKQGAPVDADPISGNVYNANSAFGLGDQIGTGNYVVYKGTGNSVTITNLQEGVTYYFAVYEFYGTDHCYKIPGATTNATTLIHPPLITSVTPTYLFMDLGATLDITGDYFTNVTQITLGDIPASSFTINSATSITAVFPPAKYNDDTLKITNDGGTTTYLFDVKSRNIIPVGTGQDMHPSIKSALDGLYASWGTTLFDSSKVIDIYAGTYTESIDLTNYNFNPDNVNRLVIQSHIGENVIIDATGLNYGVYNTLNYVTIKGLEIKNANLAGIYNEGDFVEIKLNKVYGVKSGAGIELNNALSNIVQNNLVYDNYSYGIKLTASDNTVVKNNTTFNNGYYDPPITGATVYYEDFETDVSEWKYIPNTGEWFLTNTTYVSPSTSAAGWDAALVTTGLRIGNAQNLVLSVWIKNSNNLEPTDQLEISYSYDSLNWVVLTTLANDIANFTLYQFNLDPPTNDTIYLKFNSINTTGLGEYWYIDDVKITGDYPGKGINGAGLYIASGSNYVIENNIITGKSVGAFRTMIIESGVTFTEDYNLFWGWQSDTLLTIAGVDYLTLADYTSAGANDLQADPLFVDTTNRDFHIQSTIGSYHGGLWSPEAEFGGIWTADANYSPAIDAGNPADPYNNEPVSGNRINLGAYGNTAQASKSAITYLVWTGNVDTLWSNPNNWSTSTVPTTTDDVKIPTGLTNYPYLDVAANVNSLILENGALMKVASALNVTNSIDLGQTATDSATLIVTASLAAQQINVLGKSAIYIGDGATIATVFNFDPTSYAVYYGANQAIVNANYGNLIIKNAGIKEITGDATTPTTCQNLTIETSANLTIPEGKALTVYGKLENKAGYDGLVIKSSSLGDGNLIHNTPNVLATVERYLVGTQWHYLSPPVKGADITLFNTNNFYIWDASMEWGGVGDYSPWISYTNDTLITAIGYAYYYYTTTIVFKDTLTVQPYTITLRRSATGLSENQGWNLVGNPYACAIDWDKVITQPAFANGEIEYAVYLYDDSPQTGEQANYRYYVPANGTATGVGTADASNIIPMGQGFFVKAYQDNVQFLISPDYRVHNSSVPYYKSTQLQPEKDVLRLTISGTSGYDELVYRYVQGATPYFDNRFDARKRFPSNSINQLFILAPDKQQKFAIASDDYNTDYKHIYLGYLAQDSTLTISIKSNTIANSYIYLEDKYLDTIVNLADSAYTFETIVDSVIVDRFVLHFAKNTPPIPSPDTIFAQTQENNIIKIRINFEEIDFNDSIVDVYTSLLPEWLKFDKDNMTISGLPLDDDTGKYEIYVWAKDTYGAIGKQTIVVNVINVNNPPVIVDSIQDIEILANTVYSTILPKAIVDQDQPNPLQYYLLQVDGTLPPDFVEFDPITFQITLSPALEDVGIYELVLVGKDNFGASATVPFKITVYSLITNEEVLDREFVIYPNPVNALAYLWAKQLEDIEKIEVFDLTGNKLFVDVDMSQNPIVINTQGLESGVYIVVVSTKEQKFILKFVKP